MPGLVPGIHVFLCRKQDVDGRDKRGHDVQCGSRREQLPPVVARDCEVEDHTGFGRRRQPHQRELLRASNVRRLREHSPPRADCAVRQFPFIEEFHEVRPRDIQHVGGLLAGQFRLDRQYRDGVSFLSRNHGQSGCEMYWTAWLRRSWSSARPLVGRR